MKLRNKLTGEINILKVDEDYFKIYKDDGEFVCPVTLKELNEGWEEYYEEPKEYWHIDFDGDLMPTSDIKCDKHVFDKIKEIGNYFDTREEAEKAVEKLKAVKRLKDNGFKFEGTYYLGKPFNSYDECEQAMKDLDTLIGGEE